MSEENTLWRCYYWGKTTPVLKEVELTKYIRLERGDEVVGYIFCDMNEDTHKCWATEICKAMNNLDITRGES